MPRASVWLVRAALLHLTLGAGIGALVLAGKASAALAFALPLRPVHVECILVGWTLQLAFGVAYWILPRRPGGPRGGDAARVWTAGALLNAGVIAAGLGGLPAAPEWALASGRLAEVAAGVLFATHAWPRVRSYTPAQRGVPGFPAQPSAPGAR